VAGLGLIAYLAACGFLFWRQNQLIYSPTTSIQKPASGLDYQEVWLSVPSVADPERIYSWWISASSPEKGVVLYFHGAGHNLGAYQRDLKALHQMGFSVFAIDYRGYGISKGNFPSEAQIYQDAQIAWDYLVQKRQIPPNRIYLFGVSLGGAVAIDLARQHPDAAALVVVSSFTSMQAQVANLGYWIFPIDLILTQKFESLQKIKSVRMPILLAHGTRDRYVPSWMSQKLYDAASTPKQLLLVPGIDHGQIGALIASEEFSAAMQQLHQKVPR
jgi:alpha-beta hydrolase superfamily lysophospholipase